MPHKSDLRYEPTQYDGDGDGQQRLAGTVVLFDGDPIYIYGVQNRLIQYSPVLTMNNNRNPSHVPLNDPRINALNIPLGYVNTLYKEAVYLRRRPIRHGYQGIREQALLINPFGSLKARTALGQNRYTWGPLMRDPGFTDMCHNKYPTYDAAMKLMEEDKDLFSVAFHRRLSLNRTKPGFPIYIYYRGNQVAWSDNGKLQLPPQLSHYRELLAEHNIR